MHSSKVHTPTLLVPFRTQPWPTEPAFERGPSMLLIAADVLYTEELADALAARCADVCVQGGSALVADSIGLYRERFEVCALSPTTRLHSGTWPRATLTPTPCFFSFSTGATASSRAESVATQALTTEREGLAGDTRNATGVRIVITGG